MPLLLGIILIALGLSLLVAWWSAAFVAALQVLLVLFLLLAGLVVTLTSYSMLKAQRDLSKAIAHDDTISPNANIEHNEKEAAA